MLPSQISPRESLSPRYHAFDFLRASMMLLGVCFHATSSYTTLPNTLWPFRDPNATALLNAPLLFAHVFRMPVFFVLSGFFARLLWERRGLRSFARNRLTRVILPFVVAWPILTLLVRPGAAFAAALESGAHPWTAVRDYIVAAPYLDDLRTMHLWFLLYLGCFCTFVVLVNLVLRAPIPNLRLNRTDAWFRSLLGRPWRPVLFALPTAITLFFMRTAMFDTETAVVPQPKNLAAYAVFFAFGWLLYRQADLLPDMRRRAGLHLWLAVALCPLYLLGIARTVRVGGANTALHALTAAVGALVVWLMVFGLIGLTLRYFDRPSARARYVADASYWIYLAHLPLMVWIPLALRPLELPAIVKIVLVLAISLPVLFATYHWCVRYTIIGRVLNGPRERPALRAARFASPYAASHRRPTQGAVSSKFTE